MSVNWFDRHVKPADGLPTVGIVLCHRKNDAFVEPTLPADANIPASKYELYLPAKTELKARLEQITQELEGGTHAISRATIPIPVFRPRFGKPLPLFRRGLRHSRLPVHPLAKRYQ